MATTYINTSASKNIDSLRNLVRVYVLSVTAVAVSAYRGPGLDVCPPVQENLDDPELASRDSNMQGSPSILQRDREATRNTDTWNTNSIYTTHMCLHTYIHT